VPKRLEDFGQAKVREQGMDEVGVRVYAVHVLAAAPLNLDHVSGREVMNHVVQCSFGQTDQSGQFSKC
jgi:hypothetical protein